MEVKKVVISNPFFGLRTFKVYNPPPKIEDGKYLVLINYPGMKSYLRAYSIEEEKIENIEWINVKNSDLMLFNFYLKGKDSTPESSLKTEAAGLEGGTKNTHKTAANYDTKMYLEKAIFSFFIKKIDKLTL